MATYYLDAAVGNDSNAGTSPGSGNAWATIGKALTTAVAGDVVNIKASASYVLTSTATASNSGSTAAGPITFAGYTSSPGDGGRATVTTATNSTDLINLGGQHLLSFANLAFTTTAGTVGAALVCSYVDVDHQICVNNCSFNGFTYGIKGPFSLFYTIYSLALENCSFVNCTSAGVCNAGTVAKDCYFGGNAIGYEDPLGGPLGVPIISDFQNCTFDSNTSNAIYIHNQGNYAQQLTLRHCNIYNSGSDGVYANVNASVLLSFGISDSIVYGNGGYGVNLSAALAIIAANSNNAFGSNTSGNRNNLSAGTNDVSLSGNPFTAPASQNFALNNTSGAGASCRAAGFPGVAAFGTGYGDIGALQSQAAGGGGAAFSPIGCGFIKGA